MFLKKAGPVWDTLRGLETRLQEAQLDYVVIGGLALNAHNYRRQTVDVDVVLTAESFEVFKRDYVEKFYRRVPGRPRRFIDASSEVMVDVLIAGQLAGRTSKNPTVRFPDPVEAELHGDLRTVSLARLIELKLVTWRFRDFADVVALIGANDLSEDYAEQLNPLVRRAYLECYDQKLEEDRYDRDVDASPQP